MGVIVNVVSGKGGAGKTLLTAVLAEALGRAGKKVLVADLDVFVRGLTALLFFRLDDKITMSDGPTVSDFLRNKSGTPDRNGADGAGIDIDEDAKAAIVRCRSFDVLPCVASVNEIFNFRDVMPDNIEEARNVLSRMLERIPGEYDYIFFDSRAGYDEFIAAAHQIGDCTLCVEESDRISRLTSNNLIAQLSRDADTPIVRVRNKVREEKENNKNIQENNNINYNNYNIIDAGAIPFDTDVMANFGGDAFWTEIDRSVYREALAKSWNIMADALSLPDKLKNGKRVNPIGLHYLERSLSMLSTIGRILFVYGILLALLGLFLTAGDNIINSLTASAGGGNTPLWGIAAGLCGLGLMAGAVMSSGKK